MQNLDLVQRLQQSLDYANLSWSKASTEIGLSAQASAKWKKGQISKDNLEKLAELTKVNHAWLATGQGEMHDTLCDNSNIDSTLLNQAIAITNLDKDKTIETALQFFITMHAQNNIRALRGKLTWEGDLAQMRSTNE